MCFIKCIFKFLIYYKLVINMCHLKHMLTWLNVFWLQETPLTGV